MSHQPYIDVQTFHHDGTWTKPAGGLATCTVFVGASAGPGDEPVVNTDCVPCDELPESVPVNVTQVQPPGVPGVAVIVTHLHPPRLPGSEVHQHEQWLV